jgi:hypothetical protein
MIWIVDKQVVRHLVEHGGRMAELPVRVSFEYAVEAGVVVDGTLSLKTLYNRPHVCRSFPGIDDNQVDADVQATAARAIDEHLALSFSRA